MSVKNKYFQNKSYKKRRRENFIEFVGVFDSTFYQK